MWLFRANLKFNSQISKKKSRKLRYLTSNYNSTYNNRIFVKKYTTKECAKKGLVLGAYKGTFPTHLTLTPTAQKFDSEVGGKLKAMVLESGLENGTVKVFSNVHSDYDSVAIVGINRGSCDFFTGLEDINEYKENIRIAAGAGAMALQNIGISEIEVEPMADAEAAAEGATLAVWRDQAQNNKLSETNLILYKRDSKAAENCKWRKGRVKAEAQNLARYLSGTPTNIMTPSKFAYNCKNILSPYGIHVKIRSRDFIKQKQMQTFWAITKGSCEPCFIEMHYNGGDAGKKPIVFIGKGCTFDSDGLCAHPYGAMSYYYGGMAGAASIAGVFKAVCQFKLPINVTAVFPLYENVGKENTALQMLDMLVFIDVMSYSVSLSPRLIINLTNDLKPTDPGSSYPEPRFPFTSQEFIKEYLPENIDFCHIISNKPTIKHESEIDSPYLRPNLNTGRPTRMLIQFLEELL